MKKFLLLSIICFIIKATDYPAGSSIKKLQQSNKLSASALANLNIFKSSNAIAENSGKSWYPYLKTGLDQLLDSASDFIQLSKIFKSKELLSKANNNIEQAESYLEYLSQEDKEEVSKKIKNLRPETINS